MQNSPSYTPVNSSERRGGEPEHLSMAEMLSMDFDRLWDLTQPSPHRTRSQELTSTSPLGLDVANYLAETESPAATTPVLDFDLAAIHAMQGSSFGLGMLDLLPRNMSQVTRGVRPHVLRRLNKKRLWDLRESKECHICMESFRAGAEATELPCQHLFCDACIKKWLQKNDTCPVCRYKFPDHQTYLTSQNS